MILLWLKAFHIIAVISWMAGMFYLPRLFVYHTAAPRGSAESERFKVMELKLLRFIMNPAMLATWAFGMAMVLYDPGYMQQHWLHAKLLLVLLMSATHGLFAKWRKDFALDRNTRPARFYRWANEAPTLLMVLIVILAVVKPF